MFHVNGLYNKPIYIFGLEAREILPVQSQGEKLRLTDAVVSLGNRSLSEGYRMDSYYDEAERSVPVLAIATHRDKLIDVFVDFIDLLDDNPDLVLETSHEKKSNDDNHTDIYIECVDKWQLKKIMHDYSDLFLNDGFLGIAIFNPEIPQEIQFDEHKLLFVYGERLEEFQAVLEKHGIKCNQDLFIISEETESGHCHYSSEQYREQFQELVEEAQKCSPLYTDEDEDFFSS